MIPGLDVDIRPAKYVEKSKGKQLEEQMEESLVVWFPVLLGLIMCLLLPLFLYLRKERRARQQRQGFVFRNDHMAFRNQSMQFFDLGGPPTMQAGADSGLNDLLGQIDSSDGFAKPGNQFVNPLAETQLDIVPEHSVLDMGEDDLALEMVNEEEALEVMHGALQLAEAATDELGAVTEELAGELDSGVAMEIEMLRGNIADMQNLSDEGNSAELMELAAGTSEAMSQLTDRLEQESNERKKLVYALRMAKSIFARVLKDLEYAQKTLGGGDSALSVNTQYIVEQVAESSGQSAAELRPLAANVSQMNAEHISRAADCLQTLGYTVGQADVADSAAVAQAAQSIDAAIQTIKELDEALGSLPEDDNSSETLLSVMQRARAQLKSVKHVAAAREGGGRVKSESVSGELIDILKARRAGQQWKSKAVPSDR